MAFSPSELHERPRISRRSLRSLLEMLVFPLSSLGLRPRSESGFVETNPNLARHGNVEAVLARVAVRRAAEADGDPAQGAVVHVDDAPPAHAPSVDARLLLPVSGSAQS